MPYRIIALIVCGMGCVIIACLALNWDAGSPSQRERVYDDSGARFARVVSAIEEYYSRTGMLPKTYSVLSRDERGRVWREKEDATDGWGRKIFYVVNNEKAEALVFCGERGEESPPFWCIKFKVHRLGDGRSTLFRTVIIGPEARLKDRQIAPLEEDDSSLRRPIVPDRVKASQ